MLMLRKGNNPKGWKIWISFPFCFVTINQSDAEQQRVADLQQEWFQNKWKMISFLLDLMVLSNIPPNQMAVTSCVGLSLLSLVDWSVMGVVCFACLWTRGLCPQAQKISLLELMKSCGFDLNCFRIETLSLAHNQWEEILARPLCVRCCSHLTSCDCKELLFNNDNKMKPQQKAHWLVNNFGHKHESDGPQINQSNCTATSQGSCHLPNEISEVHWSKLKEPIEKCPIASSKDKSTSTSPSKPCQHQIFEMQLIVSFSCGVDWLSSVMMSVIHCNTQCLRNTVFWQKSDCQANNKQARVLKSFPMWRINNVFCCICFFQSQNDMRCKQCDQHWSTKEHMFLKVKDDSFRKHQSHCSVLRRRGCWTQHDILEGWPNSLRVEPLSSSSNWNLQHCEIDNTSLLSSQQVINQAHSNHSAKFKWSNKLTQTTVPIFFAGLSKWCQNMQLAWMRCGFKGAVTAMLVGAVLRGAGGR